ncbi:MAG: hypothetical protein HGA45_37495, partial [Chloroflexales bacterium]|nr:hypothetical protein [Chloroflexales bacterium]
MSSYLTRTLRPILLAGFALLAACGPSVVSPTPAPTAAPASTAAPPTATPATVAPTVAPATGVLPTAAPAAGFGVAWAPEPCASFDVAEPLVARSDCGYVTVPERHAGGERTIELAVVRVRASA